MNKCPECGCHLIDLDNNGYVCSSCDWDNVPDETADSIFLGKNGIEHEVVESSIFGQACRNSWENINAVLHRPIEPLKWGERKYGALRKQWHEIKDASCEDRDVTILDLIGITVALIFYFPYLFHVIVLGGGAAFAILWTWYCFVKG